MNPMALNAGAKLGPYEIVAPIGSGGMGEVYRASDPRLGRDVAIKVLPPVFSADPDRLRRFEQEARAAAALNHPNILAVYDIGTHEGAPYIVSELLDGGTLRARLTTGLGPSSDPSTDRAPSSAQSASTGALAMRKVLDYGIQIAHGLAAAHEKGITHRDLKPENLFVTHDGLVKILDFGLAKLTHYEPTHVENSQVATKPADTMPGTMMGTMGYMAPEQVRGLALDHRADLFAFGAILYEMLTGQRAFAGATPADTVSAILEKDPPELPVTERRIPSTLARIVDRCLEKSPGARFQSTRDLGFALEAIDPRSTASEPPAAGAPPVAPRRPTRERLWMFVGVVSLIAAAAMSVLYMRRAPTAAPVTRLDIVTPQTNDFSSFALSADGRQIAFVANLDGRSRLWVRPFDQATAKPLLGTEGATYPFWAPDGRAIGFFADNKLKRVDPSGGTTQVLAEAAGARGGTWNREGVIVFATSTTSPLQRIAETGGTPVVLTNPGGQGSHRWPQFLPDGRHFLFLTQLGPLAARGIYLGSLDGTPPVRLMSGDTAAFYASGYLLRVVQGALVAQRFDAARGTVSGEPMAVAQSVGADDGTFRSLFSISDTGVLAHRPGFTSKRQLVWFDRSGKQLGVVGPPDELILSHPEISPDGLRVAVNRSTTSNFDVWLIELSRAVFARFTFDSALDQQATWSPDGQRIVFASNRTGPLDLFEKPSNGATDERLLIATGQNKVPLHWSSDGRFVLFASIDPKMGADIWALPIAGDRKPFPVAQSSFEESQGQFSSDSRWIAYVSNETGRNEIYVRPFPEAGGKWQVSTAGGVNPRWRKDGKELFYVAPDGKLMAVPIDVAIDARTVAPGAPVALFATRLATGANINIGGLSKPQYAVTRDGRFLMNVSVDEATVSPITVVLNWEAALKK